MTAKSAWAALRRLELRAVAEDWLLGRVSRVETAAARFAMMAAVIAVLAFLGLVFYAVLPQVR